MDKKRSSQKRNIDALNGATIFTEPQPESEDFGATGPPFTDTNMPADSAGRVLDGERVPLVKDVPAAEDPWMNRPDKELIRESFARKTTT